MKQQLLRALGAIPGLRTLGTSRNASLLAVIALLGILGTGIPVAPQGEALAQQGGLTASSEPDPATPEGDPENADYWRYCSIDGFAASTCGGTESSCPPGTLMSAITWVGTCRNPADGKDYIVSYNDCCGKGPCGGSFVHRNEGDKPVYYPQKSNDIGWCMGHADAAYNSTVSVVIGVADADTPATAAE